MNALQSMWFDFLRWRLRADIEFLTAQIACMREDLDQMRRQEHELDLALMQREAQS